MCARTSLQLFSFCSTEWKILDVILSKLHAGLIPRRSRLEENFFDRNYVRSGKILFDRRKKSPEKSRNFQYSSSRKLGSVLHRRSLLTSYTRKTLKSSRIRRNKFTLKTLDRSCSFKIHASLSLSLSSSPKKDEDVCRRRRGGGGKGESCNNDDSFMLSKRSTRC